MARRYFTSEEANEALAAVRPLAEEVVARRRELAQAVARRAEVAGRITGNGGGMQPSELAEVQSAVDEQAAEIERCVEKIQELGAIVKDLDRGLVDFPARRGDEDVLLCWHVGEDEVGHWHGLDDGFAGRRPLD